MFTQQRVQITSKADRRVAYGDDFVIFEYVKSYALVKFSLADGNIREVLRESLIPASATENLRPQVSRKQVTSSHVICQQEDTTTIYNHDLQQEQIHNSEHGFLRGALPFDQILCAKENSDDNCSLHVFELPSLNQVASLTRPEVAFSGRHVSVASHPTSNFLAVVIHDKLGASHSLDIYNASYNHVIHKDLSYTPQRMTAVAADKDFIFIVDRDERSLHVHSWVGEKLGKVSRQQLGINEDWIHGIGCPGNSRIILTAGSKKYVKSMYIYFVKDW